MKAIDICVVFGQIKWFLPLCGWATVPCWLALTDAGLIWSTRHTSQNYINTQTVVFVFCFFVVVCFFGTQTLHGQQEEGDEKSQLKSEFLNVFLQSKLHFGSSDIQSFTWNELTGLSKEIYILFFKRRSSVWCRAFVVVYPLWDGEVFEVEVSVCRPHRWSSPQLHLV